MFKQVNEKRKANEIYRDQLATLMEVPQYKEYIKKIKAQLDRLKKILRAYSMSRNGNYYPNKDTTILKDYISAQNEYYENDQFNQHFELLESFDVNLFLIDSQKLLLKSFQLFPRAIWPIRFHSKFVNKLQSYNKPQEIFYILAHIYRLACGTVSNLDQLGALRPLQAKSIFFNRFFTTKIMREKNLFIHIGVQKIPIIKNGIVKRYQFVQYMHFLDILGDQFTENNIKCRQRLNYFADSIFNDPAKKDHSEELQIDRTKFNAKNQNQKFYFFDQHLNDYTGRYEYYNSNLPQKDKAARVYHPIPFKPYYLSNAQNTTIVYNTTMNRWISKDHLTIMERKKIVQYQRQISQNMVKRFVDFQSAKTLVQLLTKIPNFRINLTEQEKDVIGENGNVLAIGRSGTGKTTCAVLRLFSIEMLFKIRLSLYKKKYVQTLKGVRCGSNDLDQAGGLHCIFLTASPVLTHEIQRYYKKLTENIKSELDKKKKKVQEEQQRKKKEEQLKNQAQKEKNVEQSFEQLNESEHQIIETNQKVQQLNVPNTLQVKKSAEDLEQQEQMNEQFEGIELKEDINNQQFKEQQEDIDELKNKFEQNIKKFHSLYDLNQSDYPGFFTVRSFIMMIDGVLARPFFIRSKSQIVHDDSKASWHNQRKGVMMIENYFRGEEEKDDANLDQIEEDLNYSDEEELQHEYLRQIQLRQNKQKQQLTKKLQKSKNTGVYCFEVDYDYFVVHFWPKMIKKYYSARNITPHLVWTQIYSTIKGSAQAHQYPGQYLSQHAYVNLSANTFLTNQQKLDIYETFCQYERWKIRAGGYDIMDAVNYILNVIRFRGYQGPQIHYVMIDEVQDLPHAIVYLLSKTATYGVFYSGDTAQTIAKGVGFRFCDLKALFGNLQLKTPITKHLTINFRSHNNILQLANSIVSSIQILFPKTIDRLKKEVSDLKGPKPMILSSNDEELLFYVLCGEQHKVQADQGFKKPPLEFGCDQVIIVRDQESKSKVPAMLQHALCLTIYEAKGLEFNDVILFNFFEESPCPQKWALLKGLNVTNIDVPKDQYERNFSKHLKPQQKKENEQKAEQQDYQQVQVDQFYNKEKNVYTVKKIVSSISKQFKDINDYAQLCSQLKLLYTAITRPKKTLIIYDDGYAAARQPLQKLWQKLNVIQIITKQLVLHSINRHTVSEQIKIFETIVTATDKSEWKQQGLKMYSRGYFDQAMKCFLKSGHQDLYKKAQANKFADEATKKLIEVQSERNAIKQGSYLIKQLSNRDLAKLKKKLKQEEQEALIKFEEAGAIFQSLLVFKQAGQCYFSGKIFEKAFQCFCKSFMNKQAAESLQMQNKYRQAATYYEKDGSYLKVIQCLDMVNQWVAILQTVQKFADKMSDFEKQALLKKYSALALEQLVYQIQFQNEQQANKPENNRVQVIQEKDSDEQEQFDDDEDDPQLAAQRQYQRKMSEESNRSQKQSQASQEPKALIDIKQSVYEQLGDKEGTILPSKQQIKQDQMSFSALNSSQPEVIQNQPVSKENQNGVDSIDESFGDLNRSQQPIVLQGIKQKQVDLESLESSFGDLNAKYQNELIPDLQSIKSMVDPDDVWVRNSISQITQKLHSEYSVIDGQQENYNLNVKIIKTKGNIFVQDEIMRKIVNIVSIINSSVQQFFKQFKGYQSLITVSNNQNINEVIDSRPEISQFEDIDPKFINIILDTLESFKLFKLCLFVCNRYHLPQKAGRYLISLGMKYSTNCISNNYVNPILLAPSAYRKLQIQKGILASIAIHAIYENVNSDFLKVKVTENESQNKNSLGSYFIEGLILQGLYKKAVFMVNPQQSLKISSNFNDFDAYNTVFHQKILKKNSEKQFDFLNQIKTLQESNYTCMLLKRAFFEYCIVRKFESVSQRYYREFENEDNLHSQARLSKFAIPEYLPFSKLLINQFNEAIPKLKKIINKGFKILSYGSKLQVLDFVCTLIAIIHNQQLQNELVHQFENDQFLDFYHCSNYIRTVLRKISGNNTLEIIEAVLSMHQCYKIKYCRSMQFVNDIFCLVHRTSTLANQLVQNSKTNSGKFAYFFQQDYSYILTKTSRIIEIVSKKYEQGLVKLYNKRLNVTKYINPILFEEWVASQEETIIKKALTYDIQTLGVSKKKNKSAEPKKKSKQLKTNYDFRHRGRDHIIKLDQQSDSDENEGQFIDNQYYFYRYNPNEKMRYLAHSMVHQFNNQSKFSKQIVQGRYLYGCGLSSLYRQYTQRLGGFNLFDAFQFQKFKRVDLYAENILTVFDKLTLFTRHNLLAEILTLLLVQYKSFEEPKGFCISISNELLKYFQKLELKSTKQKPQQKLKVTRQQAKELITNHECKLNYINNYVSEMEQEDIAALICDYLQLLQDEAGSKFIDFSKIIIFYVLNISKNNSINDKLRKIIKESGDRWKNQFLHYLGDCKSVADYENKRKKLLNSPVKYIHQKIHDLSVVNQGNLQKSITQSEFDYEVEGRILKQRAKAVSKIQKWWKAKKLELIGKKSDAKNYFELAIRSDSIESVRGTSAFPDFRIARHIHKFKNLSELDVLIKAERAKSYLLSFYLTTTITSSLDFHFILLNLNKIQTIRQHFFQYCSEDSDQLHQFQIEQIHDQTNELLNTIEVWKNDQKWMREKNLNLKKKKVFEVKWMTKKIGFGQLLKKRAGLKKQMILQDKKKMLKRIK